MKQYIPFVLLLVCFPVCIVAQNDVHKAVNLRIEARADFQREYVEDSLVKGNSGLRGNIVDILLQGDINEHFSYKYRQRLNGISKDYNFFDATDWLYLAYSPNERFTFLAGKWVAMIGGWDFDPAPIDVFQVCEFCYHYPCYQWGVNFIYNTPDHKSKFIAQLCESPFRRTYETQTGEGADTWAYNLMWYGNYGLFHSAWSLNFIEYTPGNFINYIALGNRFNLGSHMVLDVDFVNRAAKGQTFLFKDYSIMGRFNYAFNKKVEAYAKASYDVNNTDTDRDMAIARGTDITRLGAGVNYYPLKNDLVRVHAYYSYGFGKNTTPAAVVQDNQSLINIGVSWKMDVFKSK